MTRQIYRARFSRGAIFYRFVIGVEWTKLYQIYNELRIITAAFNLHFRFQIHCFILKPERLKDEAKFKTF